MQMLNKTVNYSAMNKPIQKENFHIKVNLTKMLFVKSQSYRYTVQASRMIYLIIANMGRYKRKCKGTSIIAYFVGLFLSKANQSFTIVSTGKIFTKYQIKDLIFELCYYLIN